MYQTIQKSNRPEQLKEDFMWESGYTHSLVAFRYFWGKPQEGRAAIVNDASMRKRYIQERIILDVLGLIFGFALVAMTLCNTLFAVSL
ncbi:MAG: hypothetical protein R2932_18880 [Caldilineaceae bacterium]